MKLLTLEEHRIRRENIRFAEEKVKGYLRRERVHDYRPGQVIYNLGEYPAGFSIRPTEYDYELIKSLSERGVGLIQVHEEWNDAIRVLGADKYTSHDPEGMKEFIKLCHDFDIKILPYVSSGFFDSRDPDFKESFATNGVHELNSSYYRYRMCDTSSPEWNEYLMKNLYSILEEYEFDGLFNDMGYPVDYDARPCGYLDYDPYFEDILARIYSMVKERGGIVKIHEGKCLAPLVKEKVYDYLWVGEGVTSSEDLITTAQFDPYMISCPDFRFMNEQQEEAFYAKTIPFMQFVLRVDGRPITGERADVPNIEYLYNPQNDEKLHFDKVKKWYESHPEGPHVYSEWSSIPDNPKMREKWFEYLALYKPMVEENSICYMDINENTLTKNPLPKGVHMSLFVNESCYLVISNLSGSPVTVSFADKWQDRQTDEIVETLSLANEEMRFLKLV